MAPKLVPGGLLIAIEGIDGAGKTTLARTLASSFEMVGAAVSLSKEPTAGKYGTMLRNSALAGRMSPEREVHLLLMDRREHVDLVISPALERGEIVILDRYFPSMVAYQGAAGISPDELLKANSFAPRPDVALLLDLAPAEGLRRIAARGDKPNAFEDLDTLALCRQIFLALHLPNLVVVDANKSAEQVAAIAQKYVLLAIAEKLAKAGGDAVEACEALVEFTPSLA